MGVVAAQRKAVLQSPEVQPFGYAWAWAMSDVSMNRVAIDRFQLDLNGEDLFLPVDPMGFVKDVVDRYSGKPVEPYKGFLRRRIEAAQAEETDAITAGADIEETEPRHTHRWEAPESLGIRTVRCSECSVVKLDRSDDPSPIMVAVA
jgi:hypothetical protein